MSHPEDGMTRPRKITHSRGVSYEITYRVDGRMVRKRLPTMKLAEQVLARARVAAMEGTYVFRGDAKTTVAEYAPQWLASVRVESSTLCTYEGYLRCHVVAHLGNRSMASLKRSDVNAFIGTLINKGLAPRTVRQVYALLAMMLRSAVYDRLLVTTPCYKINLPSVPPTKLAILSPDQVTALLREARPEHYALLALAVGTGMRQGELLGVRLRCVNFLRRELSVEAQAKTPGRGAPVISERLKTPASRRLLPLPTFVVEALAAHVERYGTGPDGLLFTNPRGDIWRRGSLNDSVWKPALRRAGIPTEYGMHALRHTYASSLIAAGLHPKVIQARLGHKSIVETMDTYGHLFPEHLHETAAVLDGLYGDAVAL
jgi:integrase